MNEWKADAEILTSAVPPNLEVSKRLGHLLQNVFKHGEEIAASEIDSTPIWHMAKQAFFVVNRDSLSTIDSELGEYSRTSRSLAFVSYSQISPSVLALPQHDIATPLGNGLVLTHELEHITERLEGLSDASKGTRERRAYSINTATAAAIDGSDFTNYIDNWPVTLTVARGSVDIRFHEIDCPEPPKDTFIYDVWKEGGSSQTLLRSIGRAAAFESVVADLPKNITDQLADIIHTELS